MRREKANDRNTAVLERTAHNASWVPCSSAVTLPAGCCNQYAWDFHASFRCTLPYLWISLLFLVNIFWTEAL